MPRGHEPLGGSGGMPPGKFLAKRSPEMQFEAFWAHCGTKKCVIFLSVFVHFLESKMIITVITRYSFFSQY